MYKENPCQIEPAKAVKQEGILWEYHRELSNTTSVIAKYITEIECMLDVINPTLQEVCGETYMEAEAPRRDSILNKYDDELRYLMRNSTRLAEIVERLNELVRK